MKTVKKLRKRSIAFCGGAYGDEGKGRIVDKYVSDFAKKGPVIVYRDNGGANAGHTVEFETGERVALHQLPSGVFVNNTTVILGKGMVIHPGDLLEEIEQVKKASRGKSSAKILIDEMAVLSLDTHRAFEAVLKDWEEGGKGSTGRGISPAYTDVLLRHPLRMRDLAAFKNNGEKFKKHYKLYEALLHGLGGKLSTTKVPQLKNDAISTVGTLDVFLSRLKDQAIKLKSYIKDVHVLVHSAWKSKKYGFVFEKAQAVGLDSRWGVYPDITASDTTFDGIFASTEGAIDSNEIEIKAAVIKATYMSSVGTRKLPTALEGKLAEKIREDAHEYGATTKRPRGIALLDLPALKYFAKTGRANALILTHMDIVYPDTPIKICTSYTLHGKKVEYRPDQAFLNTVKPVYIELQPWDAKTLHKAKNAKQLSPQAKKFLKFVEKGIGLPIHMITTGPKREQGIVF